MKKIVHRTPIMVEEVFYALTAALAVFAVLEIVKPRLVLAYVNLDYVLLLWLIFGIILVGTGKKNQ